MSWGTITWNAGNYGDIQGKCDECGTLNIPYPAVTQGSKCRLTQTLNSNVNLLSRVLRTIESSGDVTGELKRNFD